MAKAAMSSLKESEEHTSPPGGVPSPVPAPSRGEHVANSHFSKTRASSGKSGCLGEAGHKVHEGRAGDERKMEAPERGQKTWGRDGKTKTEHESLRLKERGPHPKTPQSLQSCPHSPVDLILLPPQAITVQAQGLGLGRPMGAIGPGGSRCRGHCLWEASQGCSAVHDAWVVGQLIVLGGGEKGRTTGRHQETSLPWHPDVAPCLPEPALSLPGSEFCHL